VQRPARGLRRARGLGAAHARPAIVRLDLGTGSLTATVWTCDLSAEYVAINSTTRHERRIERDGLKVAGNVRPIAARAPRARLAPSGAARNDATARPRSRASGCARLWPDIWAMMKPRRWMFAGGFLLMVVNRVSGLVLPASTKFLIDDVIGKRHVNILVPLVLGVVSATLIKA
jgi:hypothetical protein